MKTINKILAVLLFPIIWVSMYIHRVVWYDFIVSLFETIMSMFISPASFLWRLITLPIALVIDIPVGLIVTLIYAIEMCREIFTNEMNLATAIKEFFRKNHKHTT